MNTAIVFGGSGGIGQALLQFLFDLHDDISIISPLRQGSQQPNIKLKSTQSLHHIEWDPDNMSTFSETLSPYLDQPFDLCLSAIGGLHNDTMRPEKKLSQLSEDQFIWAYHTNAIVNAMIIKHIAPLMTKKTPSIIGILSARVGSISDNSLGGWYSYRAAKAALNMIIKTAAIEMNRFNKHLTIVGIHPGTVDTELSKPFQSHVSPDKLFTPKQSASYIFDHILNRVGPEHSGQVLAWDGQEVPA